MASRFPSLEEFDEGQMSPVLAADATDLDLGLDDFRMREKALLGTDADLFSAHDDDNALLSMDAAPSFESSFPSLDTNTVPPPTTP